MAEVMAEVVVEVVIGAATAERALRDTGGSEAGWGETGWAEGGLREADASDSPEAGSAVVMDMDGAGIFCAESPFVHGLWK